MAGDAHAALSDDGGTFWRVHACASGKRLPPPGRGVCARFVHFARTPGADARRGAALHACRCVSACAFCQVT